MKLANKKYSNWNPLPPHPFVSGKLDLKCNFEIVPWSVEASSNTYSKGLFTAEQRLLNISFGLVTTTAAFYMKSDLCCSRPQGRPKKDLKKISKT